MENKLYRWANINTTPLPDIDKSDFPKKYVVRVYGDDPRSGCIYCAMETAEEMRSINEDGYWEWLEPIAETSQEEALQDVKEMLIDSWVVDTVIKKLSSKYILIKRNNIVQ